VSEPEPPVTLSAGDPPSAYPPGVERWAMPFVRDFGLLPVLIAIIGHFSIATAPLLLWAVRGRNPLGAVGVLILLMLSWEVVSLDLKAVRRPARLSLVVVSVWGLAGLMAWLGNRYGLL